MFDVTKLTKTIEHYPRQYEKIIRAKVREQMDLRKIFPTVSAVDGSYTFTESFIKSVTQPFQKDWVVKGGYVFKPKTYHVGYGMVNDAVSVADLRSTYLIEDTKSANLDSETNAVHHYYTHLIEKVGEEVTELLMIGKKKAPVQGVAGSHLDVTDGLLEVLIQANALGEISVFNDEEIVDDLNAVDEFVARWKKIPEKYRNSKKLKCYTSSVNWQHYYTNFEKTRGTMTNFAGVAVVIPGTKCEIIVLPDLGDKDITLFTMEGNIAIIEKNSKDLYTFKSTYFRKNFEIEMNYGITIGIAVTGEPNNPDNQYVWVNRFPELVDSQPDLVLDDASAIAATTATISGTVDADSFSVSKAGFYYKLSSASDWTKSEIVLAAGVATKNLTALTAATQYDYKLYVETDGGNFETPAKSFTTLAE